MRGWSGPASEASQGRGSRGVRSNEKRLEDFRRQPYPWRSLIIFSSSGFGGIIFSFATACAKPLRPCSLDPSCSALRAGFGRWSSDQSCSAVRAGFSRRPRQTRASARGVIPSHLPASAGFSRASRSSGFMHSVPGEHSRTRGGGKERPSGWRIPGRRRIPPSARPFYS